MIDSRGTKELNVLACMFDPQSFEVVASQITATDFELAEHKYIYVAACKLYNAGRVDQGLDPVLLFDTCRESGMPVSMVTIHEMFSTPWITTSVEYHCARLKAESKAAQLRKLGEFLKDSTEATDEYIEQQITALEAIRENTTEIPVVTAEQGVVQMLEVRANPAKKQGTGFVSIDATLGGGVRDGQLVVIGGRPGAGKSALMAQFAVHGATKGRPSLFVSLELTVPELMERISTSMEVANVRALPMFFADKIYDLDKIASTARVMVRRHGIRMMLVDYLQLVHSGLDSKTIREQQVAHCSRTLKRLAQELKIPIIIGSQLNRESQKKNARPSLSEMRESGSIEQDADMVFLLSREQPGEPKTFIDLAKHRGGPTQLFTMDLIGREFRFQERDDYAEYGNADGF